MFARFNPLKWRSSTQALWVSFLLPLLIMTVYFGFRHMAPFGSSSILTVDLGQQYIDFFENFRQAILHNPTSIFYSFAKGLGGETYGDWAYYLFSPTNLLLLPFPNTMLPTAILLITVLKYGLAGWSFSSVSYTHLRAHETDSYLVCRLLLEKKKTTHNKPFYPSYTTTIAILKL